MNRYRRDNSCPCNSAGGGNGGAPEYNGGAEMLKKRLQKVELFLVYLKLLVEQLQHSDKF